MKASLRSSSSASWSSVQSGSPSPAVPLLADAVRSRRSPSDAGAASSLPNMSLSLAPCTG